MVSVCCAALHLHKVDYTSNLVLPSYMVPYIIKESFSMMQYIPFFTVLDHTTTYTLDGTSIITITWWRNWGTLFLRVHRAESYYDPVSNA